MKYLKFGKDLDHYGNKANNLMKLVDLGYNVPKFICVSGEYFKDTNFEFLYEISKDMFKDNLVSIRSSPIQSMPGMMETLLNYRINTLRDFISVFEQVFDSFNSKNAILYRKIKKLDDIYPGIVIQQMVFGNKNNKSGSGVFFTRDNFGKLNPQVEFVRNRQGIDIVDNSIDISEFESIDDRLYNQINDLSIQLERDFIYPQDVEFTIEDEQIYILQTRRFKVGTLSDLDIIADLYKNKLITENECRTEIEEFLDGKTFYQLKYEPKLICKGIPICPGLVFDNIFRKERVLNDDIGHISSHNGLITKYGSITAHVANICRILNKPYIIVENFETLPDQLIFDGHSGNVYEYDENSIETINTEKLCAQLMDF